MTGIEKPKWGAYEVSASQNNTCINTSTTKKNEYLIVSHFMKKKE